MYILSYSNFFLHKCGYVSLLVYECGYGKRFVQKMLLWKILYSKYSNTNLLIIVAMSKICLRIIAFFSAYRLLSIYVI